MDERGGAVAVYTGPITIHSDAPAFGTPLEARQSLVRRIHLPVVAVAAAIAVGITLHGVGFQAQPNSQLVQQLAHAVAPMWHGITQTVHNLAALTRGGLSLN